MRVRTVLFLLLTALPSLAACNSSDDSPRQSGGGENFINPNSLPPGYYSQSSLAIPTSLNDSLFSAGAPWTAPSTLSYLWSHQELDLPATYAGLTLPAQELIVAVIDTGVDKDHEDLEGRLWMNPGEAGQSLYANGIDDDGDGYADDLIGWNFISDLNNPADDNGHGTHVAGTIGAIGGNGKGISGVAPWVRIMPLKVCDSSGGCPTADIRAAIDYAVDHGAKIVNISLGGIDSGSDSTAFDASITAATQAGTLVFVAAGNYAIDASLVSPANATHAVAVAAHRSDGHICSFSNHGFKVDLTAPGCALKPGSGEVSGVASLNSRKCGSQARQYCSAKTVTAPYSLKSGTSMATPHAAGMAAVAWTASPTATPLQIRQALLRTARAVNVGEKNVDFGMGKLSATNLIAEARTAPGLKITAPRYASSATSHSIGLRIEARSDPVTWTLRYHSGPFSNDVALSGGASIGSGGTVPANASVDVTESWIPPAAGNYLVIAEAVANGEPYYDVTLVSKP